MIIFKGKHCTAINPIIIIDQMVCSQIHMLPTSQIIPISYYTTSTGLSFYDLTDVS